MYAKDIHRTNICYSIIMTINLNFHYKLIETMYIDCVIDVLGTPTIPVIPQTDKLPAAQPPLVLPNFSMGAPTGNTIAVYCLLYFLKTLRGSMDIELGEVFISLLLNWKGVLYFQD